MKKEARGEEGGGGEKREVPHNSVHVFVTYVKRSGLQPVLTSCQRVPHERRSAVLCMRILSDHA